MNLDKSKQINEIYELKHKHDSKSYRHYPFEKDLLKRTTTPYMWQNENMNSFLLKIEKMAVLMLQKINFARNFFNFTVNKHYDDYWG